MNVVGLTEDKANSFLKRPESPYRAISGCIKEKFDKSKKRLEWIVNDVKLDDNKRESLARWMEFIQEISIYIEDHVELFKNAVRLDPESFYEEYELNWYIAFDHTLTFLAELKRQNYDTYVYFLKEIYRED
ncbi:hypothetical protein [Metabacillus fastidiosus]|uniref:hypothetical protein n=1 Tax=Metabacillus fastidiosus TaxID=1458 RepID=UPI002E1BDCC7|nr:hypothetical protein [Metabacillus fastidiosus]